jgi:hypothetical protein
VGATFLAGGVVLSFMRIFLGENPAPILSWGDDDICGRHFSGWRRRSWKIPWVVGFGAGNEMVAPLRTHQVLRDITSGVFNGSRCLTSINSRNCSFQRPRE